MYSFGPVQVNATNSRGSNKDVLLLQERIEFCVTLKYNIPK